MIAVDDAFERGDAPCVERGAAFAAEQRHRVVVRPRGAVHALRDQRVVHVAHGEDPRVEVDLRFAQAARVAAAVETLVVVAHEVADRFRETAELVQQLVPPLRMGLHDGVLVVVERRGLLEDPVGHRQLPDVVHERPDCERP